MRVTYSDFVHVKEAGPDGAELLVRTTGDVSVGDGDAAEDNSADTVVSPALGFSVATLELCGSLHAPLLPVGSARF